MKGAKSKFILTILSVLLFTVGFLWFNEFVSAQTTPPDLGLAPVGSAIGLPATDIRMVVANIIRTILGILGILAVSLVLYGGYVWMTAGGNEEKVSQAKQILSNSVIGLVIILSAYSLTSFVINRLVAATTGVDSGAGGVGGGGGGGGDNPYFPSGIFYVDSLPQGGQMCIRNVHLTLTFNRQVDLATLNGNIVVQKSDGSAEAGQWLDVGNTNVAFVPTGDCGSGPADCFLASTDYTLHFSNPSAVKTKDGKMNLNCSIKAGCSDVHFTTGDGVDRNPPQVKFEPITNDSLLVGSVVPVVISYTDDNGMQKIDLGADGYFVGSQNISGCKKTGSVTINWPTAGVAAGQHVLNATGYDWSALSHNTNTNVNLFPQHCFDNTLQTDLGETKVGPPACGGECGYCALTACSNNAQCASGYCDPTAGECIDKMSIKSVSPLSGGPGTFVSIGGNYFGTTPGKVFIGNTQASLASCGVGNWYPWQIIAEVPSGAVSGPIRVETAPDAAGNKFADATNDGFGPMISNFTVNNQVRPGLCGVNPVSALPGAQITLNGQRFGSAPGQVSFGQRNALVTLNNWSNTFIQTKVPLLDSGPVSVKVTQNNLDSNSLRFFIEQGLSGTAPFIASISPDHGAKGEYVTITGRNFGNQTGVVWFKEYNNGQPGEAIAGDFSFPVGCAHTWTDTQIVVKFPANNGIVGKSYFVQVRPADASLGWSPLDPVFNLVSGMPTPGICNIDPVSGPVPFSNNAAVVRITGENFGSSPSVYFWTTGSSPTSSVGRVSAPVSNVQNLSTGQVITTQPPLGTQTGPVVVARATENLLSNPQNFSVLDCVKNNNTCTVADSHCCAVGTDVGLCKPNTELCDGETLSAGYIWRFSTRDIPKIPHVVERCNNSTDAGLNIPTPSPSAQWDVVAGGPHHSVCRTASLVVEFNLPNINNISRSNFIVNECDNDTIDESKRTCTPVGQAALAGTGDFVPQLSTENTSYLELNPDGSYNGGKWKDDTWYQVVLGSGITAGTGTSTANLAKDMSCSADSSYCFVFKADTQDCKMKQVVITPYSYRTSVLEEPIKHRDSLEDAGEDVVYSGHGISTQHCIVMDTSAFNWSWTSSNIIYADIFSVEDSSAKVSAMANTVGVGLTGPDNAVNINATAALASAQYVGHSPLTVDLNDPEVVDFWPNCLQSCTNAEVGVRFNTTMSNVNLPSGPVKLLKCNDENCFDTEPVLAASDVFLDSVSGYRILKIANSLAGSAELAPDTIYKVVLSASTTNISSPELLWSAAKLNDPTTKSKPYNKEFSWRFKTKKEKCKISRVDVAPENYIATFATDKAIFSAQPYSSPDMCSAKGQKLNPWMVSWNWSSSLPLVADVTTFSTKGNNPYCTLGCVRKGSSLAVRTPQISICGNSVVEAGEDCDTPNKGAGCGLDCKRLGNTNTATCGNGVIEPNLGETCDPGLPTSAVGCASNCLRSGSSQNTGSTATGASICGNGSIGSGEDCDLGIASSVSVSNSATNCSENCLHKGASLSNNWCFANSASYGGFSQTDFVSACKNAVSRCGDGIDSPDEDAGCDLGGGNRASWCNDFCLNNNSSQGECTAGAEGCNSKLQHVGASLLYSVPSLCGDGQVGVGEDDFCETNLPNIHTGINPWSLVTGIGLGTPAGTPPTQQTDINADTSEQTFSGTVGDKGQFSIACGYKTDAECQVRLGQGWGVAVNGCCYLHPNLVKVYPGSIATVQSNICPNTSIEATFDQEIDPTTLKNNLVLARGISSGSCVNSEDVTSLAFVPSADYANLPWYKKIFANVVNVFKNLAGQDAAAVRTTLQSTKWCAGQDEGNADVINIGDSSSKIIFRLSKPLALDTDYLVALKDGIRSKQGVTISKNYTTNKPLSWKFITGSQICEIDNVSVEPAQVYLSKAGATMNLVASAKNVNGAQIQSIPGFYSWDYLWLPTTTPYITLENTASFLNKITAKNQNGEVDVRASAIIKENVYSSQLGSVATGKSHVIVFLCENPWPLVPPMKDSEYNFSTYYCADSGSFGTADDLPYLNSAAIVPDSSVLKGFIFTNSKNSDAVGIKVFANPNHLSVSDWFSKEKEKGGQGFSGNMQSTKIDGYEALTDGNNVYVDAINYSSSQNLYSNIYLFSINSDAQPETKKVFQLLMDNLRFNINLTNYGYCGTSMNNIGVTPCQTDLDCSGSEPVCSVQIDKLKRNYQRLRDLNTIQHLFGV